MQLMWIKCQGDVWCRLDTVNLEHQHFNNLHGVYIIWHSGANAATVYVGQGNIKERLLNHRTTPDIQQYNSFGLYVTWADVPQALLNGVEAYLAEKLRPKIGINYPKAVPIEVNFPW